MGKPRKMLSDWDVPYLQPLIRLVETQSKVTLAHWAVDYSEKVMLPIWSEAFPGDSRPQLALEAARQWLDGKIKLPQAKTAILACHAAAREAESFPAAQAAARSVGQSASAIHSARHCVGLPLYGALAVAYGIFPSFMGFSCGMWLARGRGVSILYTNTTVYTYSKERKPHA